MLLLYLFSVWLKWLPTFGLTSWKHYILPVACLSFNPIAYIARQTRSSMLEVMEQDYILSLIHIYSSRRSFARSCRSAAAASRASASAC